MIYTYQTTLMTLSSQGKKLTETEIQSIENAVKDSGIKAIHPEKMEAYAHQLVERLKQINPS